MMTITAGETYRAIGTLTDGMLNVNTIEEVVLILDGVAISYNSEPAIIMNRAEKLSLVLSDSISNTLIDGVTYSDTGLKAALLSNDTLEISGDGDLMVIGRYKHSIVSDDDLIIEGGNIIILVAEKDGFHVNDNITVSGGTFFAVQGSSVPVTSDTVFKAVSISKIVIA
jgi:hypothetical protein